MFTLTRLLATLGALVVVPTVAYVMGQTVESPILPAAQVKQVAPNPPLEKEPDNPFNQGRVEQGQGGQQRQFRGEGMRGKEQENDGRFKGGQFNPGVMGNQPGNFFDNQRQKRVGNENPGKANSFGPGSAQGQGGQMGGQQFQGGGQGLMNRDDANSTEEQTKMEEQQKQQEERQLKQMKQGIGRAAGPLKMMQSQIKRLEAQKITVPSDIKEFVQSIEQATSSVQSATTLDDAQQAMETMQDAQQDFQDHFETLQKLGNWKRIQAQAQTSIRRLESTLKRSQSASKRKGALDMSAPLNDLSETIIGLKATVEKANGLMTSGSADDALDLMENEFFGKVQDSDDTLRTLDTLGNLSGFLRQTPSQLKRMKADVSSMKRKGVDTQEADDLLTELTRKLAEITTLAATKPVDPNALIEAVDDGSKLMEQFQETRDKLAGASSATDALFDIKEKSIPKLELPSSTQPQ